MAWLLKRDRAPRHWREKLVSGEWVLSYGDFTSHRRVGAALYVHFAWLPRGVKRRRRWLGY